MIKKILFLGSLDDSQLALVNELTFKLWGLPINSCGHLTSPQVLEFLPMNLEDSIFFIVDNCFFGETKIPNYKKVSKSKKDCKVGLILKSNEKKFYTEKNKPDFIINTITKEFLVL